MCLLGHLTQGQYLPVTPKSSPSVTSTTHLLPTLRSDVLFLKNKHTHWALQQRVSRLIGVFKEKWRDSITFNIPFSVWLFLKSLSHLSLLRSLLPKCFLWSPFRPTHFAFLSHFSKSPQLAFLVRKKTNKNKTHFAQPCLPVLFLGAGVGGFNSCRIEVMVNTCLVMAWLPAFRCPLGDTNLREDT